MSPSHSKAPIVVLPLIALTACGGSQSSAEDASKQNAAADAKPVSPEAASAGPAEEPVPDVVARATFVPLVSSIVPGKTFRLAVYFEIVDGYRLSWTNPGDVGEMPEVRFSAPEGFEIGSLEWPAPKRFQVTHDLSSYGYENEAAVFARVTAPRNLKTNEAYRFSVEADWVACKNQCAKENVDAFIEIVAAWRGGDEIEHAGLERLLGRVPKPFGDLKGAEHSWSSARVLVLRAPSVKFVDFYPASADVAVEDMSVGGDGSEVSLSFSKPPADKAVRGVVQIDREGEPHFFSIDASPAEDT